MPSVNLPPQKPGESNVIVSDSHSIVVVGANGAGKTRLGAFVELHAGEKAHRISAQRSLLVPLFVQPRTHEQAERTLLYGTHQPSWNREQHVANKIGHRWGSDPHNSLLNDYEHLLALLFADKAKRDSDYAKAALTTVPTGHPHRCKLDALAAIWAAVMPHRTLTIMDDRLQASTIEGPRYDAKHMSDGERVVIYLVGQSLCAPQDGVIIIDEPEIHLHRAVHALLWDEIETERADCTFVYITHDLEFAASRIGSRKIWIREFDGTTWTWEEIEAASALPDDLSMQVLGSRRPILFVEGEKGSHDTSIYAVLYPKEHVVPRQSCEKVIEATKAMASLPAFHHLRIRGLVDRDRRGNEEIAALKDASVLVADVAEVENLLCIDEAVAAVAAQLKVDPQKSVEAAQAAVFGELKRQRDLQALSRALAEIQFRMNGFGPKIVNSNAAILQDELIDYVKGINVSAAVDEAKRLFDSVLDQKNYVAALRYFNCKGMVAIVAGTLQISARVYTKIVMGVLKEDRGVADKMRNLIGA